MNVQIMVNNTGPSKQCREKKQFQRFVFFSSSGNNVVFNAAVAATVAAAVAAVAVMWRMWMQSAQMMLQAKENNEKETKYLFAGILTTMTLETTSQILPSSVFAHT